ncbi:MAG: hypothetical protein LBG17_03240 [Bacteroidales bacterium]|jgi:hypothetical protein|nr:hypothetical protein [Bacteroidales bacterium]
MANNTRYFYSDSTKTKKLKVVSGDEGYKKMRAKYPNAIETDEADYNALPRPQSWQPPISSSLLAGSKQKFLGVKDIPNYNDPKVRAEAEQRWRDDEVYAGIKETFKGFEEAETQKGQKELLNNLNRPIFYGGAGFSSAQAQNIATTKRINEKTDPNNFINSALEKQAENIQKQITEEFFGKPYDSIKKEPENNAQYNITEEEIARLKTKYPQVTHGSTPQNLTELQAKYQNIARVAKSQSDIDEINNLFANELNELLSERYNQKIGQYANRLLKDVDKEYYDKNKISNAFEYIMAQGWKQSPLGMVGDYLLKTPRQIKLEQQAAADYNPGVATQAATTATSILLDPTFMVGGAAGRAATAPIQRLIVNQGAKAITNKAAKAGITLARGKALQAAGSKFVPQAISSVGSSSGAFALHDFTVDALGQAQTGEGVSWGQSGLSGLKGAGTGAAIGLTGAGTQFARRLFPKVKNTVSIGGFVLENAVFLGMDAAYTGELPTAEDWLQSFATLGALKAQHYLPTLIAKKLGKDKPNTTNSSQYNVNLARTARESTKFSREEIEDLAKYGVKKESIITNILMLAKSEKLQEVFSDPNVAMSTKMKLADVLSPESLQEAISGQQFQTPYLRKIELTAENGKITLSTYGFDGALLERQRFSSVERAEAKKAELEAGLIDQAILNVVNYLDSNTNGQILSATFQRLESEGIIEDNLTDRQKVEELHRIFAKAPKERSETEKHIVNAYGEELYKFMQAETERKAFEQQQLRDVDDMETRINNEYEASKNIKTGTIQIVSDGTNVYIVRDETTTSVPKIDIDPETGERIEVAAEKKYILKNLETGESIQGNAEDFTIIQEYSESEGREFIKKKIETLDELNNQNNEQNSQKQGQQEVQAEQQGAGTSDTETKEAGAQRAQTPRVLTADEAEVVISEMETTAEPAPELELTPENWTIEFGENGRVETPLGQVKMGENQYFKLLKEKRTGEFGMIKPTLTNPDLIIEVPSEAKERQQTERPSSYVFIKTFTLNGKKVRHFESVTISKDGLEVVVSNHIAGKNQIKRDLINGKVLWNRFVFDSNSLGENTEFAPFVTQSPSNETSGSTSQNTPTSADKVTTSKQENQAPSAISKIQKNEKGKPLFEQSEPEVTADAFTEMYDSEATQYLDQKIEKLAEQTKKPKLSGDTEKDFALMEKWNAQVEAVQQSLEYWKQVREVFDRREAEAKEQAAFEEAEKRLQEQHDKDAGTESAKVSRVLTADEAEEKLAEESDSDTRQPTTSETLGEKSNEIKNSVEIPVFNRMSQGVVIRSERERDITAMPETTVREITEKIEAIEARKKELLSYLENWRDEFSRNNPNVSLLDVPIPQYRNVRTEIKILNNASEWAKEKLQKLEQQPLHVADEQKQQEVAELYNKIQTEDEFLEQQISKYVNDNNLSRDEFEGSEEYVDVFNSIINSYPLYIKTLADTGELQRMYDNAKLNEEIKIKNAVETAGYTLSELINTEVKKEQKKEAEKQKKGAEAKERRKSYEENLGIRFRPTAAKNDNKEVPFHKVSAADNKKAQRTIQRLFDRLAQQLSKSGLPKEFIGFDGKNPTQEDIDRLRANPKTRGIADFLELVKANNDFNAKLETLTPENADSEIFNAGKPSAIVRAAGVPDKSYRLYGNKLIKKAKEHGYNPKDLKDLPLALANPIAVFDGGNDIFNILTEVEIKGKKALVGVQTKHDNELEFNFIATIFDKSESGIVGWINGKKGLYYNKQKTLNYLGDAAPIAAAVNNSEFENHTPQQRYNSAEVRKAIVSATKIIKDFENPKISEKNLEGLRLMMLWHGTSANFDKFSNNKIGTGEGAQAFGYGLYFTELESIAKYYAATAGKPERYKENAIINNLARETLDIYNNDKEAALTLLNSLYNRSWADKKRIKKQIKIIKTGKFLPAGDSILLNAKIHGDKTADELNFMRWDKPITPENNGKIYEQLTKEGIEDIDFFNFQTYEHPKYPIDTNHHTGRDVYDQLSKKLGSDRAASEFLLRAGIDGIQYPSNYLSKGTHEKSFNYVVFDENAIEITEKIRLMRTRNGEVYGFTDGENIYYDKNLINLNTPIHEVGSLWVSFVRKNHPELWAKIRKEVQGTPYWNDVLNSPAYEHLRKDKDNLTDSEIDDIAHEAFETAMGDKGESVLRSNMPANEKTSMYLRLRKLLKEVWDWIGRQLRLRNLKPEQIEKLTFDDLVNGAVADVLRGETIERAETDTKIAAERAKEIQRIKDDAIKSGTFMKAPNGKKSKLSERQWLQVRTKEFKEWFGDWDIANKLKMIEDLVATNVLPHNLTDEQLFEAYKNIGEVQNKNDKRNVRFVNAIYGKLIRHKGIDTKKIIPQFKEVFENAIPVYSESRVLREGHKEHNNFIGYHNYLGKIEIGGAEYYVRFTTQEEKTNSKNYNPNQLHSTFISDVELYKNEKTATSFPGLLTGASDSGISDAKLQQFFEKARKARENSSKVIDENGEPLVVYHGSRVAFNEFKPGNDKWDNKPNSDQVPGIYFTDNKNGASFFSLVENDDRFLKNIFLSLKNPYIIDDKSKLKGNLNISLLSRANNILKSKGYDGLIVENGLYANGGPHKEFIAFSPNQIKSATDNNGDFDSKNPDIRYRIIGEKKVKTDTKIAEKTKEIQRIKDDAIKSGTFMKAPNGKDTKLNERQWLQVRTKEFKEWFGDWEKSARIEKLRTSKDIEITGKEIEASDDIKQYKKNALEYGKKLRGTYKNSDSGKEILISRPSLDEVLHHDGGSEAHIQSVSAIPQIIENSIYIDTLPNEDKIKHPNIESYDYYVIGLKIGNVDYTVKAVIANDRDGNRYYDHALTQLEKTKLLDEVKRITSSPRHQAVLDSKDTKLISILQTNSSKIVDGNSEPMVVAHSTNGNFTVFKNKQENDSGWLGAGYYFFGDRSLDGQYGKNVMETFLNVRNPYYASNEDIKRLSEINDNAESENFTQEVQEEGHDGVYYNGNLNQEIVAFNPNQIKSATNNNGDFDSKNPDIRYRIIGEKSADSSGDKNASIAQARKVSDFIMDVLDGKIKNGRETIELPKRANKLAEKVLGHPIKSHRIKAEEIRHINKNHGVNGEKNTEKSIPLTNKDIALIPYIMGAPDKVEKGNVTAMGAESIKYYKTLSNGYVVVVEREISPESNKMENITMWAEKSSANATSANQKGASVITSETSIRPNDATKIQKDFESAIEKEQKNNLQFLTGTKDRQNIDSDDAKLQTLDELTAIFGVKPRIITDAEKDLTPEDASLRRVMEKSTVMGYQDTLTGEVGIILPNNKTAKDVQITYLHEVVGHYGLRGLLGDKFDSVMEQVYEVISQKHRDELSASLRSISKKEDTKIAVAEEFLSHVAGIAREYHPNLIQKIINFFKDALRKMGVKIRMTNDDILNLIQRSKDRLRKNSLNLQERTALKNDGNKSPISNRSTQTQQRGGDGLSEQSRQIADKFRRRTEKARDEFSKNSKKHLTYNEKINIEKQVAFDVAKESGLWIDDIYTLGDHFRSGNENTALLNIKENAIYKSNNLNNTFGSIEELIKTIEAHNLIFPETKYEIIGFTGTEGNTKRAPYIEVILKQPFIDKAEGATPQEISDYMLSLGFEKINDRTFENEEYVISDLKPENVLKNENGTIFVIDNRIETKKKVPKSELTARNAHRLGINLRRSDGTPETFHEMLSDEVNKRMQEARAKNEPTKKAEREVFGVFSEIVKEHKEKRLKELSGAKSISRLSAMKKAIAGEKGDLKIQANMLYSFTKSLLDNNTLDGMSAASIRVLLTQLKLSTTRKDVTNNANQIYDIVMAQRLKQAESDLKKALATKVSAKDRQTGVSVAKNADDRTKFAVEQMREVLDSTSEKAVQAKIDELQDNLNNATDEQDINKYSSQLLGARLANNYKEQVAQININLENLNSELDNALKDKVANKEFIGAIQESIRDSKQQLLQVADSFTNDINAVLESGLEAVRAFKYEKDERRHNINSMAKFDTADTIVGAMEKKKKGNALVNGITSPLHTFEYELRKINKNAAFGEGQLYNHFTKEIIIAEQNEFIGRTNAFNEINKKVSEIFGKKKWETVAKELNSQEIPLIVTITNEKSETSDLRLSIGNATYVYMVWKQNAGKTSLIKMGITEDIMREIEESIPDKVKQFADWIQDDFLPKQRKRYNKTHIYIFGVSMAEVENYFPLIRYANAIREEYELGKDNENTKPSLVVGSITARVSNTKPIDIINNDFLNVLVNHINEMEKWNAFAPVIQDFNTLMSNKNFINRIRKRNANAYINLRKAGEVALGKYKGTNEPYEKALATIMTAASLGKVSFRLMTALKQSASGVAGLGYLNWGQFAKYAVNPKGSYAWAYENLPLFRKRIQSRLGGNEALDINNPKVAEWFKNTMGGVARAGLWVNAGIDAITSAIVARTAYQAKYEEFIKDGLTTEQAQKKALIQAELAYNLTQQSAENLFLSPTQKNKGLVAQSISVFKNNAFSYGRKFSTGVRTLHRFHTDAQKIIANTAKMLEKEGITADKALERAREKARRQYITAWADVSIYGFVAQFIFELMGVAGAGTATYLISQLFGEERNEDREEKIWERVKDAAIDAGTSSFGFVAYGDQTRRVAQGLYDLIENDDAKTWRYVAQNIAEGANPAFGDLARTLDGLSGIAKNKQGQRDMAQVAYLSTRYVLSLTGVDLKTVENMLVGFADLVAANEDYTWDKIAVDLSLLLNDTPTNQKETLNALKKGDVSEFTKGFVEYGKKYGTLHEYRRPSAKDKKKGASKPIF